MGITSGKSQKQKDLSVSTPNLAASPSTLTPSVSVPNLITASRGGGGGKKATGRKPGAMSAGNRMFTPVGQFKVTVVKACFYEETADVIVNSCASDLNLSRGKGTKALLAAAGNSIQDELNKNYEDGINDDDVAVTRSGKLNCKRIYHVTLPRYQAGGNALKVVKKVIKNCLKMAHQKHSTSIVFPTMGTVFLDYNVAESAEAGFEAIEEFSQSHRNSSIKYIIWAIYDQDAYKEYVDVVRNKSAAGEVFYQRNNLIPTQSRLKGSRRVSCSVTFNNTDVLVVTGKLADEQADVIVNSAPQDLQLKNGGLAESLLKVAGPELQEECDSEFGNGLDSGVVAVTRGYNLNCSYVYHGFLPKWGTVSDAKKELETLMTECLLKADEYDTPTIAFPTLGTGSLNYPANVTAGSMIACIKDFVISNSQTNLTTVTIVIFNQGSGWQNVEKAFQTECNKFNTNSQPPRIAGKFSSQPCCSIMFGNISVKVIVGQLIDERATVIVNSAPQDMKLNNGGLSEFLLRSAGQELQDSCDRNYGNGIDYGSVAVTGGYNLHCQYVYHVCLPAWTAGPPDPDPTETLEDSVNTCLMEADKHGTQSMAFPTLGTGSLNYPADVTATTMLEQIEDFSQHNPGSQLKNITIVIYHGGAECNPVKKAFQKVCNSKSNVQAQSPKPPTVTPAPPPPAPQPKRGTSAFMMHKYKEVPRTPSSWTHFTANKMLQDWNMNIKKGEEVKFIQVNSSVFNAIEQLVQDTWMTHFVGHGKDALGLDKLNYTKIRVTKVERIENSTLYEKYSQSRAQLFCKAGKNGHFPPLEKVTNANGPLLTTDKADRPLKEDIYPEINEHYCFHGTHLDKVKVISTQGLDARLSVNNALGSGIYGAESSTKADQYADPKDKRDMGVKQMLLVRVCLGQQYVINQPQMFRRPPCMQCKRDVCVNTSHGDQYDSVIIDGHWNFREFVVYDSARTYPEFVISYQRC